MDVIRIDQLSKSHGGGFRLGPLRFTVGAGEIVGLMGPGGAGKTTLLKLIWGFSRPDHGTVRVFGLTPHLEQLARPENVAIVISSRISGDLDPIADTILTLKNGNETIKSRELRELPSKCDASC